MIKFRKAKIIFQDDCLVIVDKSAGLLVVPADKGKEKDLTTLLNESEVAGPEGKNIILPCHRLDKETSGVIIFARGKIIQKLIMDEFRARKIHKKYIAFIYGNIKKPAGVLKSYIKGAWPYKKNEAGKSAITKYKVLYNDKDLSLLQVEPVTGRTNQIRIQFKNIGHPLIGERRFIVARDWPIKFKRVCLHASSIEFKHPKYRKNLIFSSPLPEDMFSFLQKQHIAVKEIFKKL